MSVIHKAVHSAHHTIEYSVKHNICTCLFQLHTYVVECVCSAAAVPMSHTGSTKTTWAAPLKWLYAH